LRRSVTTTTTSVYEPPASPRQNSIGLSAGTVVGTLLGAAAGAAAGVALYSMARNDRGRAELDQSPLLTRRSTLPAQYPDRTRPSRFVEVERTVEKIRYPTDYPAVAVDRRPPPEYIARYSQVGVEPRWSREGGHDDMLYGAPDRRSQHSSPPRSRMSGRTRSEMAADRRPLLLTEAEHHSHEGSKSSKTSRHPPIVQRSYTYDTSDRDSFVSARSHGSSSTLRPRAACRSSSASRLVSRSKTGSRVTTTTIKVGGSPQGDVLAGRHVSARKMALPPSGVGSSYAGWAEPDDDDPDDNDSIAPSDSISCVGSRRSGRSYHPHR
jgi:hypothetical protein